MKTQNGVKLRTPSQIDRSRRAGPLAARVLDMISPHVVAGVTTERLDEICRRYIVNIDVAIAHDGWFGDTSRMYFVGKPGMLAQRLVRVTYDALRAGIAAVRPGATLGDIGHAIQSVAHEAGFGVVWEH